jgi:hypothetical protein
MKRKLEKPQRFWLTLDFEHFALRGKTKCEL